MSEQEKKSSKTGSWVDQKDETSVQKTVIWNVAGCFESQEVDTTPYVACNCCSTAVYRTHYQLKQGPDGKACKVDDSKVENNDGGGWSHAVFEPVNETNIEIWTSDGCIEAHRIILAKECQTLPPPPQAPEQHRVFQRLETNAHSHQTGIDFLRLVYYGERHVSVLTSDNVIPIAQLAHAWGCRMVLDICDAFLSATPPPPIFGPFQQGPPLTLGDTFHKWLKVGSKAELLVIAARLELPLLAAKCCMFLADAVVKDRDIDSLSYQALQPDGTRKNANCIDHVPSTYALKIIAAMADMKYHSKLPVSSSTSSSSSSSSSSSLASSSLSSSSSSSYISTFPIAPSGFAFPIYPSARLVVN